jgi:hypothetical protein
MRLKPKTSCLLAVPVGVIPVDQLIGWPTPSIWTAETILGVALCDRITVGVTILKAVVGTLVKLAVISLVGELT